MVITIDMTPEELARLLHDLSPKTVIDDVAESINRKFIKESRCLL